ncbi:hypothetical protein NEMIN01_0626 [Nematocida minor]|uniref:uncharacterized protein n=1 Tax=Nematocida minor TaxID=1912983 RepID=UPI002220885D|nr:uncharacterized protein NEMIN01_0626 [Nematocida minor]KAI5189673.1 hypothetical protein NEMIN01_0626 [Nematocida minor]
MILSFLAKKNAVSDRTVPSYMLHKLIADVDKILLSIVNKESNSEQKPDTSDEIILIQSGNDALANNTVKNESSSNIKRYGVAWLKLFALLFFVNVFTYIDYVSHMFLWDYPSGAFLSLHSLPVYVICFINVVSNLLVTLMYFTLFPIFSLIRYIMKSESWKMRSRKLYIFYTVLTYSTAWLFSTILCRIFIHVLANLLLFVNIGFVVAVLLLLIYIGCLAIEFANLFMGKKHGSTWRSIGVCHLLYIVYLIASCFILLCNFTLLAVLLRKCTLNQTIVGIQSTLAYLFIAYNTSILISGIKLC